MTPLACTIASPAYHAHARVLAESFLQQHPAGRFVLLDLGLAEDGARPMAAPRGATVIGPEAVLDHAELTRMGMAYSTQGVAGALKVRLLRHLVEAEPSAAFIDADIFVIGDLGALFARAEGGETIVTPHLIRPDVSAEKPTLVAGTLNSGFLVVGRQSTPLLDWWAERTRRQCIFQPLAGLVWEQGWLGIAPALFPVSIVRDPGLNAMTRELLDRDVEWTGSEPWLSGSRLRAFHFSGPYDPGRPERLVSQAGSGDGVETERTTGGEVPWLRLTDKPGALRLSRAYAERLLGAGYEAAAAAEAPFARLPSGDPVHPGMRAAYRDALTAAEELGAAEPPNPFDRDSEERFLDWLAEPAPVAEPDPRLSRLALGIWSAQALSTAFPQVPGKDTDAFLRWLRPRLPRSPSTYPPPAAPPPARGRLARLRRGLSR
jgi:hypothetical protein